MTRHPTVTVVIPTFNEEQHLRATLDSVAAQTYPAIVEILVADGRSTDQTRDIALEFTGVRVVDNPARAQSAGLNRALDAAEGEIIVRVDGHCVLADDYVERCVEALEGTGAAMVGGAMTPAPDVALASATQRGIATAMASRLGAGPARFHVGGKPGWVDTVYLGAFRTQAARAVGGYAEDVGVNEDAEFAIRMRAHGGIWFEPRIRSVYAPRSTVASLGRQFYRYGRSRALTARRHPRQVRLRQLAAPALVLGMLSGRRRQIAVAYASRGLGPRRERGRQGPRISAVVRGSTSRDALLLGCRLHPWCTRTASRGPGPRCARGRRIPQSHRRSCRWDWDASLVTWEVSVDTMPTDARIFVAGHRGLVGSAVLRRLAAAGYTNVLTASREQLDLRDQAAVNHWFQANRPEYVFLVAGTVGGIMANSTRPAEFLYDNMMIHSTVVHASHLFGVTKLLYLGSSCIYPRHANQPITESELLTGALEPTNEPYAIAKIAGIKLCQSYRRQYGCNFISAMPTNLYGPNDNFDLESSHVLPALMAKFHQARLRGAPSVEIWGSGTACREFLHVDDLADACLFLMDRYEDEIHINVGTGEDLSIRELAETIRDVIYPTATLAFDATKPDGTPRKLLDVSRLHALGWTHTTQLRQGVEETYKWYVEHETDTALAASR